MFPNVRVVIAALLATIVGISCGLGVLAALRINHPPFTRLQSVDAPLQLAFGAALPVAMTEGMPASFGARFVLNAPQLVERAIAVPPSAPPPAATAAGADAVGRPQAPLDSPPQPDSAAPQDGGGNIAAVSALDRPEPMELAAPDSTPAIVEAPPAEPAPAAELKSTAVEPAPFATVAPDNEQAAKPTPSPVTAAPATEKQAPKVVRRRLVSTHRPRKPQIAAAAAPFANQNFGSPIGQFQLQGSAQEMPQATSQAQQPAKHAVAKRHRPVKKAAARTPSANQTASGNTAIAAAGR